MTPQQRSDLYARMNADFLDVCDLIVRKAGEKQRDEGLANAASQHRCSYPSEEWLPVKGYEGLYSVSDAGRVRSDRRSRILSPVMDGHGYPTVRLGRDGVSTRFFIHRLVAEAFHAEKRNILHKEVAHLDGSRTNAAACNVKWVSRAENCSHKRIHGTHQAGESHPRAKLTARNVQDILASSESNSALARKYGVRDAAISKIRKGQRWQAAARLGAARFDQLSKEEK